jgi:potassium-transporting ATPase ATP-binding subunit
MASIRRRSIWDTKIISRALGDAVVKLSPTKMMMNPVMFVVEIGSLITTIYTIRDLLSAQHTLRFDLQITSWLWFTVLFANFAEAMAEGRGKAQAEALRKAKSETIAVRLRSDGTTENVPSATLRADDVCVVTAGSMIPGDGEVIEGVASVDESAITGESAPVIREAGGDRSAVTGGTRVLSDELKVRITSNPGETFLDRMIALVEGVKRQKTPNEIALNILLAGLTIIFLLAGGYVTADSHLFVSSAERIRSNTPACLFDSYNYRRPSICDWHRRHGSPRSVQRTCYVGARCRSSW